MRIIFAPISIALSLVSAMIGKSIFSRVWGMIDEEEPPGPEDRQVDLRKLVLAGALQGVVFRLSRVAVDRGLRRAVYALTGSWPGDTKPDRA
jgi:Protein of unknown function (DUF4235)